MSVGPVEYIAIAFPGTISQGRSSRRSRSSRIPGTIRVLDIVIISKDNDGNVAAVELGDASPEEAATLAVLGIEGKNLLGLEDIEDIGGALDPNSTCALMIWENAWAAEFAKSLRDADGILIANGRIPAQLVEEAMAASVS